MPPKSPFPAACKSFLTGPLAGLAGVWGGWGQRWSTRIGALACSPDGTRVAAGGADGQIRLFDAASGKVLAEVGAHEGGILALAFSPDGAWLLAGSERVDEDARLRRWPLAAEGQAGRIALGDAPLADVTALAVLPGGAHALMASGEDDGRVYLLDLAAGKAIGTLGEADGAGLVDLVVAPDGKRAWVAGFAEAGPIAEWDLQAGTRRRAFGEAHVEGGPSLALSPDGRLLLSVTLTASCLWDAATGALLASGAGGSDCAFLDDATPLVASPAGLVAGPGAPARAPFGHGRRLSAGAGRLATGDAGVHAWHPATGAAEWTTGGGAPIAAVAFAEDGRAVAWADRAGDLHRAALPPAPFVAAPPPAREVGQAPSYYGGEPRFAQTVACLADGGALVLQANGALERLDSEGGRQLIHAAASLAGSAAQRPDGNLAPLLAVTPDGERALAPLAGIGIAALDLQAGSPPRALPGQLFPVFGLALSPDERLGLAYGGSGVLLWDVDTGAAHATLADLQLPVKAGAFLPDGGQIVLAGYNTLGVWDVATGQRLRSWPATVSALALAPDGSRIWGACRDGTIRAWEAASGAELGAIDLRSAKDWAWCLAVSPAGDRLLAGTAQGAVLLFALR